MLFKSTFIAAALAVLATLSATEAHVGLRVPCARGTTNKACKLVGGEKAIDYDTPSPIANSKQILVSSLKKGWKSAGLCKHTDKNSMVKTKPTLKAGKTIATEYETNDPHYKYKGGHCQWALSYDNGKHYVVFQDKLNTCFKGAKKSQGSKMATFKINVKIPSSAPAGNAIFLWIFYNEEGNREIYTACSDVKITNSSKNRKFSGVEPFIANFGPSKFGTKALPDYQGLYSSSVMKNFTQRKKITITAPKA
ncbi:hypothetical protein B0O80DRAFT_492715 [Mortierella sp. GBAus27b]|nr:hypothetical protein BGX31_002769 [Mortierella sp. GBA43]KAI8363588.1 hypothetical protein B0O80DRAFT_492715 [Mortierella sp. GBAus27b]